MAEVFGQLDHCHVESVQNTDHSLLHIEAPLQLSEGELGHLIGELLHLDKEYNNGDCSNHDISTTLIELF